MPYDRLDVPKPGFTDLEKNLIITKTTDRI